MDPRYSGMASCGWLRGAEEAQCGGKRIKRGMCGGATPRQFSAQTGADLSACGGAAENGSDQEEGEREKFFNLVPGTIIDFGLGAVSSAADHDQHTATTDRVGDAEAMGDICDTRFSILFVGAGQPFVPVIMVDRVVAKHP